jgi:hypothetical protein
MRSRMVAGLTAVALIAAAGASHAQSANPKAVFTSGLASFSVAIGGSFGDEGPVITNALGTMDRARQQWDAVIRAYEIRSSPPGCIWRSLAPTWIAIGSATRNGSSTKPFGSTRGARKRSPSAA